MRPTYSELLRLNPLLEKRKPEELERLLITIEDCGYVWDPSNEVYHHPQLICDIGTHGIDMLTPETFKRHHEEMYQEYDNNPEQYMEKAQRTWFWCRASFLR